MANTMTGRIHELSATQSIPTKSNTTVLRREIVLDCTRFDQYTGEKQFENFPAFEFSGDKCSELDNYNVGDVVTISFDLSGSFYENNGVRKNFTRVRGYKIERVQRYSREQQLSASPYVQPTPQLQQQTAPQPTPQQHHHKPTASAVASVLPPVANEKMQSPAQSVLGLANDLPF